MATVAELQKEAKELGITGTSNMNKSELEAAIQGADGSNGADPTPDSGADSTDTSADSTGSTESTETVSGVEKLSTRSDDQPTHQEPSPPGFKPGKNWNSDDARAAYEAEGSTLEEQARIGAEGEPPGTAPKK